ncbi:MAG TPA: tetratricopeptide repeat protein [Acidobacteriaceae bacterium]|nr:tetratricopeptide repeat protein [Acidobacteriaceae bacterium]
MEPAESPANSAEKAESFAQQGLDRLHSGDAAAAAVSFAAAVAADTQHIEAHHGLIRALTDSEQFDAAIAAARRLTELTPDDPLAFAGLSIALQRGGHIPEAESAAGRARILEWKHQLAADPAEEPRI